MSSELEDLYQNIILDHNKQPRNYGELDAPTHQAEGFSAVCGDRVQVYLQLVDGELRAIQFTAAACAICKASASLMTTALSSARAEDVAQFKEVVRDLVHGEPVDSGADLGELMALSGVSRFPARRNCAELPWSTLASALESPVGDS